MYKKYKYMYVYIKCMYKIYKYMYVYIKYTYKLCRKSCILNAMKGHLFGGGM